MTTATVASSPRKGKDNSPATSPTKPPSSTQEAVSEGDHTGLSIPRPSAEDLVDLERELHRLINRKTLADAQIMTLETRLYDLETEYLTETAAFGNLIHGLEGYLGLPMSGPATANSSSAPAALTAQKRNFGGSTSSLSNGIVPSSTVASISPQQRLFSATSATFAESLALAGRMAEALANGYTPPVSGSSSQSALTAIPGLKSGARDGKASSKGGSGGSRSSSSAPPPKKTLSPSKKTTTLSVKAAAPRPAARPTSSNGIKRKGTDEGSAEWVPPPMKSSRKK